MLNRVSEKIPFGGGWEREGGRAEQNSGPFEMVSNFKMRFEKKIHFRGGGVADMHLP